MKRPSSRVAAKRALAIGAALTLASMASAVPAQESQWGSGKALYDKVCGYCHDPEVGVGTPIQGRALPVEYIRFIVRNGFNAMPAFPASYIDDESLAQVTEYIASLPPAPPSQP
jgi:mono/diheme cytochrome c family protein